MSKEDEKRVLGAVDSAILQAWRFALIELDACRARVDAAESGLREPGGGRE